MSTKVSTDLIDLSSNTGGLVWAKGTTAQQPASATAGEMRVDTTTNTTLVYNGTQWKTLKETAFVVPPVPTHFLVIAGGGGGGAAPATNIGAGGGGAGGLRTSYGSNSGGGGSAESTTGISLNTAYTITVGAGGAGAASNAFGIAGGNSIFDSITSIGGGGGANYNAAGSTGGSGGGSYVLVSGGVGNNPGLGTNTTNGDATNQGFNGGTAVNGSSSGGGGGAGSVGLNSVNTGTTQTGNGGNGLESEISGSPVTRAGGGGGGRYSVEAGGPGTGGTGGGGAGGNQSNGADASPANSGSGGGGSADGYRGGSGSSGIVILRYPTADLPYFTTTGTLNTPSAADTVADTAYPVTNTAYYKLDTNANDSGLGSGYIGQGGIFNGSSSIVTLPSALSDGTTTDAVCISFWFNVGAEVTSSTTDNEIMTFAYSGGSFGKIALGSTTGNFSGETFSVSSDLVTQYTYSKTNIPAGWNHAVVQWNSGWNIYINGVAHTTYTFGTNEQGKWALKFGQRSSYYYNGILDQVRIFPTVLSSSNIALLYAETSATSSTLNYPVTATALYEFSGNANSTSSSAYNGTATNVEYAYNGTATNITYGNGRFNEAANFNGTSSVISLGTSSSFSVGTTGSLSLSLWVKTTVSSTGYLMSKANDSTGQYEWAIEYNGSQLQLNVFNTALGVASGTGYNTTTINDGNWHHVAAVIVNNTSVSLYIDNGAAAASSSWSGTTAGSFSIPTLIGHFGGISASTSYWEGNVDQVRIFSSALAPGDVEDLYNEHFPTKFTDGSDTALMFTGGTGDITFLDTDPSFNADYLVVAGAGGSIQSGGNGWGNGGGGAGGLRTSYGSTTGGGGSAETALTLIPGTNYTVTVGAGGISNGSNSIFNNITSDGGGTGGINSSTPVSATNGGSGGGGGGNGGAAGNRTSPVQGYNGGPGSTSSSSYIYNSGGGGGAGGAGAAGTASKAGDGGVGLAVNIISTTNASTASVGDVSGSDVYFASGGGGAPYDLAVGTASAGGGADGVTYASGNAINGTPNTGGGGGGLSNKAASGSSGGSGVVILRYPSAHSITIGSGLTQSTGSPFTEGTDKISVFTAGTGTITFS